MQRSAGQTVVRVFLHRAIDGYAFVRFDRDSPLTDEYVEAVEAKVFSREWADEWLGPAPSMVETMDENEVRNGGKLPVEDERDDDTFYLVGVVKLDPDEGIVDQHLHEPMPVQMKPENPGRPDGS